MKATDLLKKQHKEVKALFKKVEGPENARQRRQFLNEISQRLEGHTLIEEDIFYPAVRSLETEKAEEIALEAYEEHHVVKLVVAFPKAGAAGGAVFGHVQHLLQQASQHGLVVDHEHGSPVFFYLGGTRQPGTHWVKGCCSQAS